MIKSKDKFFSLLSSKRRIYMIICFKFAYLINNGETMIRIILVLLFIFKISVSFSHSQLSEILPKDNVTYVKVPSQINMKFNSLVKLVKIVMIRVDKKEKINLDLTSLNDRAKEHSLPMPKLSSGKYRIEWRALSQDGHIIKGKSDFEVK